MIFLDRNESQYGPSPKCFEALRNIGKDELTQYTRDFNRGVKSRVSEKIAEWVDIPEENILLSYGSEGLLKYAVHKFLPKGGTLMVPDKSWWYYGAIAKEVQGKSVEYLIPEGENSFYYDIENMIEMYHKHKPEMVFIASPNNPTGNAMSHEDMKRVLAEFKDSIVIVDEAYWGFTTLDNANAKELVSTFDNVLIFRTFSKYFGLAGIRMGYGIASDNFKEFAAYVTRYLGYSPVIEDIALAALNDLEYYEEINSKYQADIKAFHDELAEFPFIKIFDTEANFVLIRMHEQMFKPLQDCLLAQDLSVKFFTDEVFNNHIRLSLGTQEQNRTVLNEMIKFAKTVNA